MIYRAFVLPVVLLTLFFSLQSCGPATDHYMVVDSLLLKGDVISADAVIEKNRRNYSDRNILLYYMDRGMTLHLAGRYQESNQYLEQAEEKIEDLFTKRVTTEAAAFLTNDNLLPYAGEDFEKVMINLIKALNYMYLGKNEDALVEARRVDHKLNIINDKYADKKNAYKEDAFARYLAGILYETGGDVELNDAWISYRKSLSTYNDYNSFYRTPVPAIAVNDALRLSYALGQQDILEDIRKEYPEIEWRTKDIPANQGELIFISYNGKAPKKEDNFIDIPLSPEAIAIAIATADENNQVKTAVRSISALKGQMIRIALPKFVPQKTNIAYAELYLNPKDGDSGAYGKTVLVENITAIALRNLEDRILRITAKAVARAAVKKILALTVEERAKKEGGPMAGLLLGAVAHAAAFATEQADKRSWRTLPDEIQLARLSVLPGTYDLQIRYISKSGATIEQKLIPDITIRAGEKRFISNRIVR